MKSAFKVGLLTIIFVVLLAGVEFFVQKFYLAMPTYTYYAGLTSAKGIKLGSPVTFAGIEVGKVTQVTLDKKTKQPVIRLNIDVNMKIPIESTLAIPSSIMGVIDNKIEIVAPEQTSGKFFKDGDTIPGDSTSSLASISPEIEKTIDYVTNTLKIIQDTLVKSKFDERIKEVFEETNAAIKDIRKLSDVLSIIALDNKNNVDKIITKSRDAITKFDGLLNTINKLEDTNTITRLFKDSRKIATNLAKLSSDINVLYEDGDMANKITNITNNIDEITERGTLLTKNATEASKRFGKVLDKTYEVIDKTSGSVDRVDNILDEGFKLMKNVNDTVLQITPSNRLTTHSEVSYNINQKRFKTDINVLLPYQDKKYLVGFYDAFESNAINARMIYPYNSNLEILYGAYAGKPSVGLRSKLNPKLSVMTDAYGLNEPKLDARAQLDIHKDGYIWVEGSNLFRQNDINVGIGAKW